MTQALRVQLAASWMLLSQPDELDGNDHVGGNSSSAAHKVLLEINAFRPFSWTRSVSARKWRYACEGQVRLRRRLGSAHC